MAPRTVVRSLSRIAVAVAALMVAVSVIIGVGVMIGSFRQTVVLWLDDVLQADIFISPPSLGSNAWMPSLDPALAGANCAPFPASTGAATTREVDVVALAPDGAAIGLAAGGAERRPGRPDRRYRSAVGDWQQTWQAVRRGRHPDQRADGQPLTSCAWATRSICRPTRASVPSRLPA
jgi:putative ABC transport system permease protein